MGEDHETDHHASSAEINIVKLQQQLIAMKDSAINDRTVIAEIKMLLVGHINNSDVRHSQVLASLTQHVLEDTVVHQRVLSIQQDIDDLSGASKRDPATFWTAVGAAGTAVGAGIAAIFGGK